MTSATERLRSLLDERGVEYRVSATGYSIDIGPSITAYANRTDTTLDVSLRGVTPEQAIDATLGRGTCHDMYADDDEWFACSECNTELRVHEPFGVICSIRYCPNCGRRVDA